MSLLKGKQVPVACTLARRTEQARLYLNDLKEQAEQVGLTDAATELGNLADTAGRLSVSLDSSARQTFVAARRGAEIPS